MELVKKQTKTSIVIATIQNDISKGILKPGDRMLGMQKLAERFNVSFAVINHAYKTLESEGLIVRHAKSGTFVNPALKFNNTKLVAVFTGYQEGYVEGYFESLFKEAGSANSTVMVSSLSDNGSNNTSQAFEDVMARNPDLILIDVEGRRHSLDELKAMCGTTPYCFVNRWEWDDQEPSDAVLIDYTAGYINAFNVLKSQGHKRIIIAGHHKEPQNFVKKHLKSIEKATGLSFGKELLYTSIQDWQEEEERVLEEIQSFSPTAIFGMSDFMIYDFIQQFQTQISGIKDLYKIGVGNQKYSNIPGHEYISLDLNFAKLWEESLTFTESTNSVRYIQPELKF